MSDLAGQTMEALRLAERTARMEGAHEGAVNDIVKLEHAVGQLRAEIHALTLEIRRVPAGVTWSAIFAGAFSGSVSGLGAAIAVAFWFMSSGLMN